MACESQSNLNVTKFNIEHIRRHLRAGERVANKNFIQVSQHENVKFSNNHKN